MNARHRAAQGWAIAVLVYLLAVFHRSSLGVAGLLAERRFGITPAQLSVFILLQLGVYAAMQIPTGVLVDRYGPRRLLVVASLLMASAQLLFAVAPSYPIALLARALLGCGDALTFVSVLRFAATHFSPRRYPVMVALTSTVGTVGNVLATLPLSRALDTIGWGASFAIAAGLSAVTGAAAWLLISDPTPMPTPVRGIVEIRNGVAGVAHRVRAAWSLAGTRLGFWMHFACMSSAMAFGMLWGHPYLVRGAGFSTADAGAVLMYGVIGAVVLGPLFGWLIGHRPGTRVPLALGICLLTITGWILAVTIWGDHPPRPYVLVLFVVMALGIPTAMAAFAVARDYNHAHTLGTASGVVNVGGFLATVLIALGIGWVLDGLGGTTPHTLRLAALVAIAVQVFGTVQMAIWLRRTRAYALDRQVAGMSVPVAVVRRRWDIVPPEPDEIGPGSRLELTAWRRRQTAV